ncbi:acetolactate synthase-1/2/3 large subunit [Bradyrhizobium sp. i1.4.4]
MSGQERKAKGSDLFVAALENEGVDRIFGIPGEENLDLVESLRTSKIELVLTRHEQAAAFMAATHGRLTGRPGVCLSTLGPGALNLSTGAAYAHLGAMPMILITGQKPIMSSRQARFQIVDVVATMKPLTKLSRQIISASSIPTVVRDAFRVAMEERPGPVHLELPEDIAGDEVPAVPVIPVHPIEIPVAHRAALDRAAEMILAARRPLVMMGAATSRPRSTHGIASFVRRTGIPFFTTQMGKGTVPGGTNLYMGTAALSERDYVHDAIDAADLIVAIGHDPIEKPPFIMGPSGPKVIHVSYTPASVELVYFPDAEVVGDVGPSLELLADRLEGKLPQAAALLPLREGILTHIADRATEARWPPTPQRIVHDIRQVIPENGIVALDNGMYKIWFARNYANPRRQHAAARQCAGDDGRRSAVGHDGRDALSRAPRARGCRRRRLHDEQPGDGDRRPPQAQFGRAGARGQRLRHDPLEAGRRSLRRLRHDLWQSRFRPLREGLRCQRTSHREHRQLRPDARCGLQGGRRASGRDPDRLFGECARAGRRAAGA